MTAPMRPTPRPSASAVPASQNTAPVAEFRCLFTRDTRKKQKKWQDGYLKFHSFNSRVIVYDMSRLSVGDTYYKDSPELHEGDELMLDKGIMVEVAEPMGVTQTDLTPLFERKVKDSPNGAAGPQKPPQRPLPRPTNPASNPLRAASQLRHKSLNTLLGASRAPIGKAVPIRTPYEERIEKENRENEERAAKRQKTTHAAPAQQLARPSTVSYAAPNTTTPAVARPSYQDSDAKQRPPNTLPHDATVISLSSQPEIDNIPSDVTLPYTPSKPAAMASPVAGASVPARKERPACTTPRLPKGKLPLPHIKAQQTPQPRPPPSSPPVSASNRITNVDSALQLGSDPPREPSPVRSPPPPPPPEPVQKRKTKTLKFSNKPKRGMLLCQSVPVRRPATPDESIARPAKPVERAGAPPSRSDRTDPMPHKNTLQFETARHSGMREHAKRPVARGGYPEAVDQETEHAPLDILDDAPLKIMDDPELVYGFMDQQLLVPSSPPTIMEQVEPQNTAKGKIRTTSTKKSPKSSKRAIGSPPEEPTTKKKRTSAAHAKDAAKPTKKKKPDKQSLNLRSSSPTTKPTPPSKTTPTAIPESPPSSRHPQTPFSPATLASLSTGGFKKKFKMPPTIPPHNLTLPPAPQPTHLPPHPLRSSLNGPLMTTTELSALLTHGPADISPDDDPIEDASQDQDQVPLEPAKRAREPALRRSRSENDAPVPEVSAEWEARNLRAAVRDGKGGTGGAGGKGGSGAGAGAGAEMQGGAAAGGNGLASLIKKTDPRRKFARTRSLGGSGNGGGSGSGSGSDNVNAQVGSGTGMGAGDGVQLQAVDEDVGPWSSEAFDLFDWKPPGKMWVREGVAMKLVDEVGGVGRLVDGK